MVFLVGDNKFLCFVMCACQCVFNVFWWATTNIYALWCEPVCLFNDFWWATTNFYALWCVPVSLYLMVFGGWHCISCFLVCDCILNVFDGWRWIPLFYGVYLCNYCFWWVTLYSIFNGVSLCITLVLGFRNLKVGIGSQTHISAIRHVARSQEFLTTWPPHPLQN